MSRLRVLLITSLLIALNVVLRLVAPIDLQFLRVSFSFLPVALAGILFGPLAGALTGGLGDIIGWVIKPLGPFFPGFTLSGMISGALYGFFFFKKRISIQRVIAVSIANIIVVDVLLNTLWLSVLYNKAASLFVTERLIKAAFILPVEVTIIFYFNQLMERIHLKPIGSK